MPTARWSRPSNTDLLRSNGWFRKSPGRSRSVNPPPRANRTTRRPALLSGATPTFVRERRRENVTIIAIGWWRWDEWLVLYSPTVMSVSLAAVVGVSYPNLLGRYPDAGREPRPVTQRPAPRRFRGRPQPAGNFSCARVEAPAEQLAFGALQFRREGEGVGRGEAVAGGQPFADAYRFGGVRQDQAGPGGGR